jgi:hypothetical protein
VAEDSPPKAGTSLPSAKIPSGQRGGSTLTVTYSVLMPLGLIALVVGVWLISSSSYSYYNKDAVNGYTYSSDYTTKIPNYGRYESRTDSGKHGFGVFFCLLASVAWLVAAILFLLWLSRAWSIVPPEYEGPPPGMVVGLLCVPFFNLYWMFRVIPGLSTALQRMLRGQERSRPLGTGFGVGVAACIVALIPFVNAVSLAILFPLWLNLANRAKNRVIELEKGSG